MARHRAHKPVARDRQRRRWLSLEPQYAAYPDVTRPKLQLQFRPDFPPDYSRPADLRDAQQQQGDDNPGSILDPEKHQLIEPLQDVTIIHHHPPHPHRDTDSPLPPRESRTNFLLRRKGKLSNTHAPQTSRPYPSFAHAVRHTPPTTATATATMPRSPSPSRHSNPRADRLQAMLLKERSEWERQLHSAFEENAELKRRIEHLNSELAQRDVHIRALKHTISKSRSSNTTLTTDSQITADYTYLLNQLKNWTLSNFRGSKPTHTMQTLIDFGLSGEEADAVSKYLTESSPTRKFLAVSMLVMRFLAEHVFASFLFGADVSDQRYLHGLEVEFSKTASTTDRDIQFWRAATAKMVSASDGHKRKVHEQKKELIAQLESLLINMAPPNANTARRVESLKVVVNQAVSLALTLKVQRARYYLLSTPPGRTFKDHFMEPAEDEEELGDSDDGSGEEGGGSGGGGTSIMSYLKGKRGRGQGARKVALTVFPALIKSGNEDGDKYDENVCVCKARALRA